MPILTKYEILETIKKIRPIYEKDGLVLLGLFGSYARDEATENSDVDLLYDVDNLFLEKYRGFRSVSKVLEIQNELSAVFNTRVDLTSPSGLSQNIKDDIVSKAIYV